VVRKRTINLTLSPIAIEVGVRLARKYGFRSLSALIDNILTWFSWLDIKYEINKATPELQDKIYDELFTMMQNYLLKNKRIRRILKDMFEEEAEKARQDAEYYKQTLRELMKNKSKE